MPGKKNKKRNDERKAKAKAIAIKRCRARGRINLFSKKMDKNNTRNSTDLDLAKDK